MELLDISITVANNTPPEKVAEITAEVVRAVSSVLDEAAEEYHEYDLVYDID